MPSLETAQVGNTVAKRVGENVREVRTKLGMTQAQLAAPEFSISYISAIERGKIRPSLKALSILARRLDVPLAFLLEGSPAGVAEARAIGYAFVDSGRDQRVDVDLLHAHVLLQQGALSLAQKLLEPIQPDRVTTDQVYRVFLLRGKCHLGEGLYQEAVMDLRSAVSQGEALHDVECTERARNDLGKAYFLLCNYTLAVENHVQSQAAIESGQIPDPIFSLDVLSNLANDYFHLGEREKALAFYRRALELLESQGRESSSFARLFMEMSQQYKAAGKLTMAREYAMQSLALYEMLDQQRLVGLTHLRLGRTLLKQDDFDGAESEYRRAIEIERELGNDISASTCHTALAELLLKCGKLVEAEAEAQEALSYPRASADAETQGQALIVLALIRDQAGDSESTDLYFTKALELLDTSNAHDIAASAYFRFANVLETRGEVQRSLGAIKKAYEHQREGSRGAVE